MHNLEKLISEWRKSAATNVSAETLDELETHLRETTEQLVRSGMNLPDAFQRALADLGNMPKIASEFRKLDEPLWLPVKLAIGVTALLALILAIFVIARLDSSRSSLLLAAHVFTISLGYTLTLLIGGLGICFVSQRCVEDFSTSRLHSIARVSLVLGSVALFFTTLGVLLAMVWAKIEWGHYWAWDPKEIGGLSVVVWLACGRAPVFQKQRARSSCHQHARKHCGKPRMVWTAGERFASIRDAQHFPPADNCDPGQSRFLCHWLCPGWPIAIKKRRIKKRTGKYALYH